jgi:hypothetical protein
VSLKLINNCFKSPWGIEWQVRRSLRWFEPSLLEELGSVQIESEMPEAPQGGNETEWARDVRALGHSSYVNGWYAPAGEGAQASIMLYGHPIYRSIPRMLWWTTVPTLRILSTLAHEVAHHLVATRGYVFEKGEDVADEEALATRFSKKMVEATAMRWSYRLGRWCIKDLSNWYYIFAMTDWEKKDFSAAARRFYKAWDLSPDNDEAAYWYWEARERSEGPSS